MIRVIKAEANHDVECFIDLMDIDVTTELEARLAQLSLVIKTYE